ncbi:MAG: type II toxin-antitoxin system VapC family toxin [Rhodocyclaceae bacterium]|nr:type II toxin-antitoxin system VapC family toxin [Rhodocyclaceae bacterium]
MSRRTSREVWTSFVPTATSAEGYQSIGSLSNRPLWVAEPSARWQARPPLVIDCSTLIAWLFEESEGQKAAQQMAGKTLHAPTLLPYEVANVARNKRRAGAPSASVCRVLGDFQCQDITWHTVKPPAVLELAERYGLTAYDAAYLWVAAELKAPLATFDRRLAEAAKTHLGNL